ncbi:FAD-binding oxidoreductase [Pseudomonas hefeiensis]|uniref:FAD-binding oxidoreductase n=1 Tax=Pseudomonas hefeiensis TaxID=2738125 RepID=A0ABY9G5E0_9PSED|nr:MULTISPECIES: FAD-binding oxidoreductase [unclassified Pseudomonas]WLH10762.1 FAD-binding oxidoreductase [Pseudomonas sp. FP205]WLH93843.1 FAD-binding oxidoreductase [Pseudomonas sp. FP53]WLI38119.1 FAD-binding oxidoreductase [Pseudomonas sp. FP821]
MQLQCNFLPQNDGQPGWYETLPPPAPGNPLKGAVRADWAVLGAGLAGLAAARRLAELLPEASIALIDAKRVGFGAAGRNSGFMVDLPHDLTSHSYTSDRTADQRIIRLSRGGIDFMRQIVQREGIECDWREQGKLHGAVNPQGIAALESFAKGLNGLGEPYTMLDAARMKAITGTDFYKSGLHAPGCVLVQPAALCRGLAQSLPANVTLYEDSPVLNIELGKPHALTTAQGVLSAPRMVMANNAYAAPFGQLGLKGRLLPVYTYASLTRELTAEEQARLGGDQSWGLIPADPLGTTVRRLANGRICIRNSFTYNPRLAASPRTLERVRRAHRHSFEARFPMLPGVPFEYTWGGALCISRNSGSAFGEIAPDVFSAVCCNGLGLTRSTVAGKLIAEYAVGMDSELLDIMLDQPAPCWNPPEPFLGLGLRSSIAWKEWQAGAEL